MNDQPVNVPDTLRPVMDAAHALAHVEDLGAALRALRQVEVAVELATDLLMRESNARTRQLP